MNKVVTIAKALSDSNRVRSLLALRKGELCVCMIIELLGLAPSTVSKHMTVLKHAGLVDSRKEERWIYYRLVDSQDSIIKNALDWVFKSLEATETTIKDSLSLSKIICQNPETICKKRQMKKIMKRKIQRETK